MPPVKRPESKTRIVGVRFSQAEYDALVQRLQDMNVSDYIRSLINA